MTTTHNRFLIASTAGLLLLCLFNSSVLYAQKSPFSVSLTGGVSFPVGAFAGKEFMPISGQPNQNGAARSGLNTNLQINARISPKFGITVTGGVSKYNRNVDRLEEIYGMLTGDDVKIKSNRWEVFKLLAGPSLQLPLASKLSFRACIAAGVANTSMPSFKMTYYDRTGTAYMTLPSNYNLELSSAFAYQANAGIGYKVGEQLSLLFDVSYFGARTSGTEYRLDPPIVNPRPGPAPQPVETILYHKYPLNAISALIGLEWQF